MAVTGLGLATPIGNDLASVSSALQNDLSGVRTKDEWVQNAELETSLAAEVRGVDLSSWPRKKVRSMGRVARLATYASERAVEDAGLDPSTLGGDSVGLAYGSTHGSSAAMETFARGFIERGDLRAGGSNVYLQFMSHTCAANLALFFGIRGRVLPTCAACASGSMAIGYGYEAVRDGAEELMICGGAEELHVTSVGVFDVMYATSTHYADHPERSPRPFDAERDGLVVGEGAGTLVLEEWDRAVARGANIHAEVIGFGTNSDGTHVTAPSVEGMADCMRRALASAGIPTADVDYVNAHATATAVGDRCESHALHAVFGEGTPVSSTKGFTGHTLGASGAIEAAFCLAMMKDGFLAPTKNLSSVGSDCAPLDYVMGDPRQDAPKIIMNNSFAFGGINASILLRLP